MDDERWEPGMPVLDRQPVPADGTGPRPTVAGPDGGLPGSHGAGVVLSRAAAGEAALPPSLRGLPPRSVPEAAPTPLQKHFVLLSVPVLILGAIAITALELGSPLS